MIPRGRVDIGYSDIIRGLFYCCQDFLGLPVSTTTPIEDANRLICLSVRTGFDLLLTALNLPPGSEIIVSNISIPDMFAIITAHQLTAVPVSINKDTLNTSVQEIKDAISTKTKAILITHLFGAVGEINEVVKLAAQHDLIVIEDGAQAYAGSEYKGHPETDVVMQSFGMIKTNTAISGSVISFSNPDLAKKVRILNNQLPVQPVYPYFKKLTKAFFIRLLTIRWVYTLVYYVIRKQNKDIDQVLSGFTRGFPGADILEKIRYRACEPLKRLLTYKLLHYPISTLVIRKQYAESILSNIPAHMVIGPKNARHSHWVLPVAVNDPQKFIKYLRQKGFDATSKASSLVSLPSSNRTNRDMLDLSKLVYLPAYANMGNEKKALLIKHINHFYLNQ
jgi:perosamine synthetase